MLKLQKIIEKIKNIKSEGIIGIDFGTYTIKAVEIKKVGTDPVITGFVQGKVYENSLINGIIQDKNLVTKVFMNVMENLSSSFNKLHLALPYELVIFDSFKIEEIDEDKIKEKINEEIPYKIEDVYYSYYAVPGEEGFQIYYVVTKKDTIIQYIEFFESCNFTLVNIDVDFINVHNILDYIYGEKTRLIIDWGYNKIKLLFCDKKAPVYGRELFHLGLKRLRDFITKEFHLTPDIGEKLMLNPPSGEQGEIIKQIYKEYITEILEAISHSLNLVLNKFNFSTDVIFLIGGGARIPGIEKILSKYLDIEVFKPDLTKKLQFSSDFDAEYIDVLATQGIVAMSVALKNFI